MVAIEFGMWHSGRKGGSSGSGRPRRLPSPLARARPARNSFLNHGALELGKHAHHLKHRLTGRRRRVEPLLVQEQVDAEGMQLRQEGDQVLQAAAEPI